MKKFENRISYQIAPQSGKLIHFAFIKIIFFHSFCIFSSFRLLYITAERPKYILAYLLLNN